MNKTALQWMVTPLRHYAMFSGRAPRAEYWWFILFATPAGIMLAVVSRVMVDSRMSLLVLVYNLAMLVPSLAVAVRRFHEIDRSGWWLLMLGAYNLVLLMLVMVVAGGIAFGGGGEPNLGRELINSMPRRKWRKISPDRRFNHPMG
ncbi:DUF805 domain-containing protein [Sandarakinorhabdus sp.]|uniref:DUF805 domain-containing protein n=1 Tax=Sandarakinorhabdus sp. TaxID=1916663 RepID=UPI0033421CC0